LAGAVAVSIPLHRHHGRRGGAAGRRQRSKLCIALFDISFWVLHTSAWKFASNAIYPGTRELLDHLGGRPRAVLTQSA